MLPSVGSLSRTQHLNIHDDTKYVLFKVKSNTNGHILSRWISRDNAVHVSISVFCVIIMINPPPPCVYYCIAMGTVIVDQYYDLFVPLHSFMTKAVASVWDAYGPQHVTSMCNKSNIEVWMGCSFAGH
jgi:hypothetical protein